MPEQWKIAKIIPTHKKGAKDNVENYRPISNLCAISKIYEKLILGHLWDLANSENIDLTGENQHGFKKEKSTVSAALHLQSTISRALDNNNYYALASLDLSSAFDIVNRELLYERLKIFGIPDDARQLIENWLEGRLFYVECTGHNSTIHEDNSGTIQGSVLGPVLFCLFIRPIFEIVELIAYADDNYMGEESKNLEEAIQNVKEKTETVIRWMTASGLKTNEAKTEICIFHRNILYGTIQ